MDAKQYREHTKEVALRLKEKRYANGFSSAAAVADALGWVASTYESYELGTRVPPIPRAHQIAKLFGVTPQWILFGDTDPSEKNITDTIKTVDRMNQSYMMVLGSYDMTTDTLEEVKRIAGAVYGLLEVKGDGITYSDILKLSQTKKGE